MNLSQRLDLLERLGEYMLGSSEEWMLARERAEASNLWFTREFLDKAIQNIGQEFLDRSKLDSWADLYQVPATRERTCKVGVVMAGNIPLVGFHDLLCVFVSGHQAVIKTSSRDNVLIPHLVKKLIDWEPAVAAVITSADPMPKCQAYIATGSNNSGRYFEYYFSKYPSIIRKSRTSVAVLDGTESQEELGLLADDVYTYFGLGCRNVTRMFVPEGYDFIPLLSAFKKYDHLFNHHKYRNNYDFNLAVHMLNNKFYMSNSSLLVVEDEAFASPIAQLNYSFYSNKDEIMAGLQNNPALQCVVGHGLLPFGEAQHPSLADYADGVDTMKFLLDLNC